VIERYQNAVASNTHRLLNEYDAKMEDSGDLSLLEEANKKICGMAKEESTKAINQLMLIASQHMKNGFSRADN
jgi:dipeptidase